MAKRPPAAKSSKTKLHSRNPHKLGYDFEQLCASIPELEPFVHKAASGRLSIDFSNSDAVKLLNQALLKTEYGIEHWDIPEGYLCPPIPGRADYIHALADLLSEVNEGAVPCGRYIKGLDIGTGANCIYPILGACSYNWQFVGADIDPVSVNTAKHLVKFNRQLKGKIQIRQQAKPKQIFHGVIKEGETFTFTLCNPPFHGSAKEAEKANLRKVRNLSGREEAKTALNFAGQSNELWCEGGELAFVRRMVKESAVFAENCLWFTCLISKKENLSAVKKALSQIKANEIRVVEMAQGNKVSRFIAWSFYNQEQRSQWAAEHWGN